MRPSILIVIPTYNHFDYAARAVESALANTTLLEPHVVLVDDASPDRLSLGGVCESYTSLRLLVRDLRHLYGEERLTEVWFEENGGLTRSWNCGLKAARDNGHDFCCVANSDLIFAPGWDNDVFTALDSGGYALVGPVTNAPGTNHEQYVGRYSVRYDRAKKDDRQHIADVQRELATAQRRRFKATTLNGFCMVALTSTWWANRFDDGHVFRPRNDFNSKGEPNPTPLMTLNEYELQRRWHAKGLKSAACLGSYVFHYRAVSRGDRFKKGDWVRIKESTP